jgi:hypothetical protein
MPNMQMIYKEYQSRIEQAESIDHEESREELLLAIRKELQPLVREMYKAIGRSIRFHEDADAFRTDSFVTASTRREDVYVTEINLTDAYRLKKVQNQIANLELKKAKETAEHSDTSIRERIPDSVWNFFKNRN